MSYASESLWLSKLLLEAAWFIRFLFLSLMPTPTSSLTYFLLYVPHLQPFPYLQPIFHTPFYALILLHLSLSRFFLNQSPSLSYHLLFSIPLSVFITSLVLMRPDLTKCFEHAIMSTLLCLLPGVSFCSMPLCIIFCDWLLFSQAIFLLFFFLEIHLR